MYDSGETIRPCCGSCKHYFTRGKETPCKDCKNFEYYEQNPYNCGGCKYNKKNKVYRICKECTDFDKYEKEI